MMDVILVSDPYVHSLQLGQLVDYHFAAAIVLMDALKKKIQPNSEKICQFHSTVSELDYREKKYCSGFVLSPSLGNLFSALSSALVDPSLLHDASTARAKPVFTELDGREIIYLGMLVSSNELGLGFLCSQIFQAAADYLSNPPQRDQIYTQLIAPPLSSLNKKESQYLQKKTVGEA